MFYRLPKEEEENRFTVCPKRSKKIILQIAPSEEVIQYTGCPKNKRRKKVLQIAPRKGRK